MPAQATAALKVLCTVDGEMMAPVATMAMTKRHFIHPHNRIFKSCQIPVKHLCISHDMMCECYGLSYPSQEL